MNLVISLCVYYICRLKHFWTDTKYIWLFNFLQFNYLLYKLVFKLKNQYKNKVNIEEGRWHDIELWITRNLTQYLIYCGHTYLLQKIWPLWCLLDDLCQFDLCDVCYIFVCSIQIINFKIFSNYVFFLLIQNNYFINSYIIRILIVIFVALVCSLYVLVLRLTDFLIIKL